MVIFPGLKHEIFQVVPDTLEHSIFYLSDQIHPPQISKSTKTLKKTIFGQISNISLIFDPLPILGLSFNLYYFPLSGHFRSCISQNFVFKTYAYTKLWRKTLRGRLNLAIIRVKVIRFDPLAL